MVSVRNLNRQMNYNALLAEFNNFVSNRYHTTKYIKIKYYLRLNAPLDKISVIGITSLGSLGSDALQNTKKYPIVCSSLNITFDTEL